MFKVKSEINVVHAVELVSTDDGIDLEIDGEMIVRLGQNGCLYLNGFSVDFFKSTGLQQSNTPASGENYYPKIAGIYTKQKLV